MKRIWQKFLDWLNRRFPNGPPAKPLTDKEIEELERKGRIW